MSQSPQRLHALAEKQHQVISRGQALDSGLTPHAIRHRLRPGGPWRQILPRVYVTVTGVPTSAQREVAAVLYAGPQAAITGPSALRFHRLTAPESDLIDVLVPLQIQRQSISYVRIHRTARMPAFVHGPVVQPYVSPARAAADTALWLTELREVRAVVAGAVQSRLGCTADEIADELRAGPVRHSALLRMVLAEVSDGVRSAPEGELRDLIVRASLPTPLFNPRLYLPSGDFLGCPDAWWSAAGLAAEVDSKRWHLAPEQWEHTMDRHARFAAHGIVTLHFSPHQLRTDGAGVIAKISSAYRAGTNRPPLPITVLPAAPVARMVAATRRS